MDDFGVDLGEGDEQARLRVHVVPVHNLWGSHACVPVLKPQPDFRCLIDNGVPMLRTETKVTEGNL